MKIGEIRDNARKRMNGACRVCRHCAGIACAGELPGMGGIRSGRSFQANIEALEKIFLKMRVIHDVRQPGTECEILGLKLAMPALIAPMAGASFNMGSDMSESRFAQIVVQGAEAAGIAACTGDGTKEVFEAGLTAIRENQGRGIAIIKPWAGETVFKRLDQAASAGCAIAGMDIDTCAFTALVRSKRPVCPKSRQELRDIVNHAHSLGLKFVLKGVMSVEDALDAQDCLCDGLVVSNHGGRALEALPGTATVLRAIAENVRHIPVLADGGIRSGADILKMLALGAKAVLIGRPAIIGAMGGEEEGVKTVCTRFIRQLEESMTLTGCEAVDKAGPHLLLCKC